MRGWWHNQPVTIAETLKGAQRIVYEEIERMLAAHRNPSVLALSYRTGYSHVTVGTALTYLQDHGLLKIHQARRGGKAKYEILHKN